MDQLIFTKSWIDSNDIPTRNSTKKQYQKTVPKNSTKKQHKKRHKKQHQNTLHALITIPKFDVKTNKRFYRFYYFSFQTFLF